MDQQNLIPIGRQRAIDYKRGEWRVMKLTRRVVHFARTWIKREADLRLPFFFLSLFSGRINDHPFRIIKDRCGWFHDSWLVKGRLVSFFLSTSHVRQPQPPPIALFLWKDRLPQFSNPLYASYPQLLTLSFRIHVSFYIPLVPSLRVESSIKDTAFIVPWYPSWVSFGGRSFKRSSVQDLRILSYRVDEVRTFYIYVSLLS